MNQFPSDIIWDVSEHAPDVYDGLIKQQEGLGNLIAGLRQAWPVAASVNPFSSQDHVRPADHNRCFYKKLKGGGVLAFKGTEPCAKDWPNWLTEIQNTPSGGSILTRFEHFVLIEQKVPTALIGSEAMEEAEMGMLFQRDYLKAFGELAPMPTPILITNLPEKVSKSFMKSIFSGVSKKGRLRSLLSKTLDTGLVSYSYFYPNMPLRAANISPFLDKHIWAHGYTQRIEALEKIAPVRDVVEGWLRLFSRILLLGYLPASPDNANVGQCVDQNNVVIDGGFADIGSLHPFSDIPNDRYFMLSLSLALQQFGLALQSYLLEGATLRVGTSTEGIPFSILGHFTLSALSRYMEEESREFELSIDPRLQIFLNLGQDIDTLSEVFSKLFPGVQE